MASVPLERTVAEAPDVETASETYAGRFSGPVGRYFLDVQARIVLELLRPWQGGRILDVGGGHAQLAVPLAASGFRVTVTGSTESCRARLDRLLPEGAVRFVVCDSLCLPFPDGGFDVAIAFRLLPHVDRWRGLVGELCRVARRAVIADYPDVRSANALTNLFFRWKKAAEKNTRPYRCFSRREMRGAFAGHRFGGTEFRPEFLAPMVLHRIVGRAGLSRRMEEACRAAGLTRMFGSPVILRTCRTGEPLESNDVRVAPQAAGAVGRAE